MTPVRKEVIDALMTRVASAVTRAKLVFASYAANGARTMLQLTGMTGEVWNGIELILPYGMSAMPVGRTADLLIIQINGNRDHKVAIGADDPACRIAGLQPGEFGFQDIQGQQVVFKRTGIVINTPLAVAIASASGVMVTASGGSVLGANLVQATNDAAAAADGVPINGFYHNGNGVQIRLT
jgi:phage gp45-like